MGVYESCTDLPLQAVCVTITLHCNPRIANPESRALRRMPLTLPDNPSIIIRREAFERAGLVRAELDERFGLTDQEFLVEGELIVVGPLFGDVAVELSELLEARGLVHFDDYFDLSGNWPGWLRLFVMAAPGGASGAR